MSDQIQFEGENNSANYKSRAILGNPQTPKMIRFLINKGIVKSEKSAGYLLLGVAILFFCLAVYILYAHVFSSTSRQNGQTAPIGEWNIQP